MIQPQLAKNSDGAYDLVLDETGTFVMAEDGAAAAVDMVENLLLLRDEAEDSPIVDTVREPLAGLDWHDTIIDTNKTQQQKDFEFKRCVLSTPNIVRILKWSRTHDSQETILDFMVQTSWGSIPATVSVGV